MVSDFHCHTSPSSSITGQQSPLHEATKNNAIYLCVIQPRRIDRRKKCVKMKLTKTSSLMNIIKKSEQNVGGTFLPAHSRDFFFFS
jgi:hypothetical protein